MREVCLGAYAHQDVPFALLVDALRVERDLSRNPLFQVVFVLQNAPLRSLEMEALTFEPFAVEVQTTPFDMVFSLSESGEGLAGTVIYSTALFREETVRRTVEHYRKVLEGVASDPDQRLSDVRLMEESEIPALAPDGPGGGLSRAELESLVLELSREMSQSSQTE
nr:condensation domain-containing protein [uncultured bacterium]